MPAIDILLVLRQIVCFTSVHVSLFSVFVCTFSWYIIIFGGFQIMYLIPDDGQCD